MYVLVTMQDMWVDTQQHTWEVGIIILPIFIMRIRARTDFCRSIKFSWPSSSILFQVFIKRKNIGKMENYRMCSVKQNSQASALMGLFLTLFQMDIWCLAFWKIQSLTKENEFELALLQRSWGQISSRIFIDGAGLSP